MPAVLTSTRQSVVRLAWILNGPLWHIIGFHSEARSHNHHYSDPFEPRALLAFNMDYVLLVFRAEGFEQIRIGKQALLQLDSEWSGVGFRIIDR